MRIGIAQINSTLGDFKGNSDKILDFVHRAFEKKCTLVVFPECSLFGYHPFDLLERQELVEEQLKWVSYIEKRIPKSIYVLLGLFTLNPKSLGRPYFNSVALVKKQKKTKFFHKQLLPTGDVFDEARFVKPGRLINNYFKIEDKNFFLTICEDIWAWPMDKKSSYDRNPLLEVPLQKVDLVINMSASPYFPGKLNLRHFVTQKTSAHFKAPLMYVNMVGAQDEIIYDGASFVIQPNGKKPLVCYSFEEDLNVYDIENKSSWHIAKNQKPVEELRKALVLGISDFCKKTGFKKIHLGVSGGIDSALVAALAVDALGPQNVTGIALPGPFNKKMSLNLAKKLCKNLGVEFKQVPINSLYKTFISTLSKSIGLKKFGLVHENLQSRLRGITLMAYANLNQSLLLSTSNKSEMATGYATLYGDMCGGLAPIGDLTKKQVYELCAYYNHQSEVIPIQIIQRPPSAELRPNQKDEDNLPPYRSLDAAVEHIVEKGKPAENKIEKWLFDRILKTEFKRWQAPPILKVSSHSFGRGRRFPVALKSP
ncbi:MAG TPA: NAD+ synthase [Pseudobdellovibrionaceae bacterium]|nr:NAD+ synthase [Pseudobdellovibrionaceae bacterium]